ncbi:MAG: STAS domain-containing protein [Clostridia bacterium]|jgi:anti-sigma B factor antagonist|nr:STAS domain-containing protein [Clostridia bacterium]MBT7121580.1 STAS domain-containing protein [Clostridia bacterium]
MLLDANYNESNNRWDVNLYGEVDIYNADSLKNELHSLIAEKSADIVLDCTNLKYIDSTGLGVLVNALKKVKETEKSIRIVNLKPYIAKIFTLTGLDKIFVIEVSEQ